MSNIRQIRNQIKGTKNIAKITKAMQMVSASKMKRAQDQAQASRSYALGIAELCFLIAQKIDPALHPLLVQENISSELVVLIAPEKGLCGGLVTALTRQLGESFPNLSQVEFIAVGKKAKTVVAHFGGNVIADFSIGLSQPKYDLVPPLARVIQERFLEKHIGKVTVLFPRFVNTMVQKPSLTTLLPLHLIQNNSDDMTLLGEYLFEPSSGEIVEALLKMYLEIELYQLLLDSYASEQSARMVAMKNATDNALDLLRSLTQGYNKVRQANITEEIINISTACLVLEQ